MSLESVLQSSGFDQTIAQDMPYTNGVIAVLSGQVQNDGNIITQDLQSGMSNLGMTTDDLTRFLFRLDDNLKSAGVAEPAFNQSAQEYYRTFYFTLFLEYVKLFSNQNKFATPADITAIAGQHGVPADELDGFLTIQAPDSKKADRMYSMSVKNPEGIRSQLCPWLYVYNDATQTRVFLTTDEMVQYDRKFGKKSLVDILKKNIHITGIVAIALVAITVAGVIIVKRHRKKKKEEEEATLSQLLSEAPEDGDL